MIVTYKYRVKDRRAARYLREHAVGVNQAWNYCVDVQKHVYRQYKAGACVKSWPTHIDLQKMTSGTSVDLGINSKSIHGVCRQFTKGRDRHKRTPRYRKSFGSRRSLGWVPILYGACQIKGNYVNCLGRKYRFFGNKRRPLPANAKGNAFVEDASGRWFVCFSVEVSEAAPRAGKAVGIDLGLSNLITCSDGTLVKGSKPYRNNAKKLGEFQRTRRKRRVTSIYSLIRNTRSDYLHKLTTELVRRYAVIVVGVPPISLTKTRLAKSVHDAAWGTIRHHLRYKARRHGVKFIEVPERLTTQLCSSCHARSGPIGNAQLGMRAWECGNCGASHDRDVNAALNILALGLSAQPLAEGSQVSDKREDLLSVGLPSGKKRKKLRKSVKAEA